MRTIAYLFLITMLMLLAFALGMWKGIEIMAER